MVLCKQCGKEFSPKRKGVKFCSRDCYYKSIAKEVKHCKYCGKEFTGWRDSQEYCSMECYCNDIGLEEITKTCPTCGVTFTTKDKDQIHCSQECCNHQEKTCEVCGSRFISNSYNQKVCSAECKKELDKRQRNELREIKCIYCGNIFLGKYGNTTCDECRRDLSIKAAHKATEYWHSLSDEERDEINLKRGISVKEALNNKSQEEINERNKNKADGLKKFFANMTEEEYQKYHKHLEEMATIREQETGYKRPCQMPQVRASHNISSPNLYWQDLLNQNGINLGTEYSLGGYSYDLGNDSLLIDIHPFAFHNITWHPYGNPHPKNYHYKKIQFARENGYRSIAIWDWDDEEKILGLLNPNKIKIGARECMIKEIKYEDANGFINQFHLQSNIRKRKNDVYIGLFYKDTLIECMSFGTPRYTKKYQRELLRLCTHKDYQVVGGASKIFTYFIENYNPQSIISYCDLSKFDGGVYEQLGFTLLRAAPSAHRYNPKTGAHTTGRLLSDRGADQLIKTKEGKGTDNRQLMIDNGYVEIYDCGQAVYIYT